MNQTGMGESRGHSVPSLKKLYGQNDKRVEEGVIK